MVAHLREETARDHWKYDCFVCVIMSHGEKDVIFGVDGEAIPLDTILECVDGNNAPSLICKPKIFLIDASQGGIFSYSLANN